MAKGKGVNGFGIFDADHPVEFLLDGKKVRLKSFETWRNMIYRVYSGKYKSYDGCSISEEWVYYSAYKSWFDSNFVDGFVLDKDFTVLGNKIYSKETCSFIPQRVNKVLCSGMYDTRGKSYPLGVAFDITKNNFIVQCNNFGKSTYLGRYHDPSEGHVVWKNFKIKMIGDILPICGKEEVQNNLERIIKSLRSDTEFFSIHGLIDYTIKNN